MATKTGQEWANWFWAAKTGVYHLFQMPDTGELVEFHSEREWKYVSITYVNGEISQMNRHIDERTAIRHRTNQYNQWYSSKVLVVLIQVETSGHPTPRKTGDTVTLKAGRMLVKWETREHVQLLDTVEAERYFSGPQYLYKIPGWEGFYRTF